MKIAEPKVRLIAHTKVVGETISDMMERDPHATDAEHLIEFAGRSCYESFGKPNEATRKNADYIQRTVFEQGHGSIAEHATATLYFTGVSRALTHELVRHRMFGYSQLSQRFVSEEGAAFVVPPALRDMAEKSMDGDSLLETELTDKAHVESWLDYLTGKILETYEGLVGILGGKNLSRKQAREAARCILPNMIETKIIVTGNLRAWREMIDRRTASDADAEIQEVMRMANRELNAVSPTMFPIK